MIADRGEVEVELRSCTPIAVLAAARLGVVSGGGLPDVVLFVTLFGCVVLLDLSVLLRASRGRQGGSITRWPWRPAVGNVDAAKRQA